jgi:3-hydroxybutyryl-CoA dehydratase
MSDGHDLTEGTTITHSRTFTKSDVDAFIEVSQDENDVHREADEEGRLIVHGLLTATLPTKIGGDLSYIARELNNTFHQPVYTGEEIRCEMTITDIRDRDDGIRMETEFVCRNEDDAVVLTGDTDGVIYD